MTSRFRGDLNDEEKNRKEERGEKEREREKIRIWEKIVIVFLVVQSITLSWIYTTSMMDPNPIGIEFPCNELILTDSVITNF